MEPWPDQNQNSFSQSEKTFPPSHTQHSLHFKVQTLATALWLNMVQEQDWSFYRCKKKPWELKLPLGSRMNPWSQRSSLRWWTSMGWNYTRKRCTGHQHADLSLVSSSFFFGPFCNCVSAFSFRFCFFAARKIQFLGCMDFLMTISSGIWVLSRNLLREFYELFGCQGKHLEFSAKQIVFLFLLTEHKSAVIINYRNSNVEF